MKITAVPCSYTKTCTGSFEPIRSWGQTPVTNTTPIFLTLVSWLDKPFSNCFILIFTCKRNSNRVPRGLIRFFICLHFIGVSCQVVSFSSFPLFSEVSVLRLFIISCTLYCRVTCDLKNRSFSQNCPLW